jgi:hypothetical protein
MRKIYVTLCMLLTLCAVANAQFTVTFQVDMNNVAVVDDTVSVAGSFQVAAGFPADWSPGSTILTDPNADGVYTVDVNLPAGTYQYKFLNGAAWGTDESVPGACAVSNNREITISGNTTIPVVCFGSCAACPSVVDTVTVTLQVDMSNETVGGVVSVAGDLQAAMIGSSTGNWTPGATLLTDANSDGIYEITFDIPEGTYQYKYLNGAAWGTDEAVPSACAVNNNREIVVAGPGPIVVPVHCFGTCSACVPPLPPINVTFRVDMTNEIVSSNGLFVAGSFQNPAWVKDTLQLSDANSDGVYEYTQLIEPAEYQYKYYNGNGGDPDGENADFEAGGCGATNGIGGYNRVLNIVGRLSDTILPVYYFNTCSLSVASATTPSSSVFASVTVSPNPFGQSAIVDIQRNDRSAYSMRIVSVTGQVVMQREGLHTDRVEISREGLRSGLYFLELRDAKGSKVTEKIVIQ